jgi:hypothetical protein
MLIVVFITTAMAIDKAYFAWFTIYPDVLGFKIEDCTSPAEKDVSSIVLDSDFHVNFSGGASSSRCRRPFDFFKRNQLHEFGLSCSVAPCAMNELSLPPHGSIARLHGFFLCSTSTIK